MSADVERDERLRAALRHAPDAALAAPPDLSAQILAAAHRAAAERAPAHAPPKRPWWAFPTPRHLGASGAFATVLLAGVLGLLWRGQQPGPETAAYREAAAPVAAPAPRPAAKPVEQPTPMVAAAPEPPQKATTATAVAPRLRVQQQQEQAVQARARADESKREASVDAGREVARDEERRAAELKEQDRSRLARDEAASPPPPPPAAAPAPAPAAAVAPDGGPPVLARRSAPALTGALMARPRPNGPWMDALAAGNEVQWKIDGEARAPSPSWLSVLAEQTQGRWRAAVNPSPPASSSTVQWRRGDALLGGLWLGDDRVLWCDLQQGVQSRCEEAALDAGVGPVLRKGLTR